MTGRPLPVALVATALLASACAAHAPSWDERLVKAEKALGSPAISAEQRFYTLPDAAKAAFETGRYDAAQRYARELLDLAPGFDGNWNYGNAIHDGHMVLGRLALRRDDLAGAARELAAAGDTPGSPQLDSFGPNMSLAKAMLERGQQDAVIDYFGRCGRFWSMGRRQLRSWTARAKDHQVPDFGANLLY